MKMTYKKLYCLAAAMSGMLMITSAMADTHWTGNGGNNDWNNAANWTAGVPSASNFNAFVDPTNGYPVIGAGESAYVGQWSGTFGTPPMVGTNSVYPTFYGPEWGQTLDIYGSLNVGWIMAPVGSTSVINLYDGGSYTSESLGLGENWWYNGGPGVTMNQFGGTVNVGSFYWGGTLNLSGGTFTVNENNAVIADTSAVADSYRMMNISGTGEFIIAGNATSMVQNWESRNIIEGNGTFGNVNIDTTSMAGYTVITAAPEPTSLAFLGLGGLLLLLSLRLRSRRRPVA